MIKPKKNILKNAMAAVLGACAIAGIATPAAAAQEAATEVTQETGNEVAFDRIPMHTPTGCSAAASSKGKIMIACFGNPYQGDPNPGMSVEVDTENQTVRVFNRNTISPQGELSTTPEDQQDHVYDLNFEEADPNFAAKEISEATGVDFPTRSELQEMETGPETGYYQLASDQGNLTAQIVDQGRISKSSIQVIYVNPDGADATDTRKTTVVTMDENTVNVQYKVGEQQLSATVEMQFDREDFRYNGNQSPATQKTPKK